MAPPAATLRSGVQLAHPLPLTSGAATAALVELDADHPGFLDAEYRRRRNEIAHAATTFRDGAPVPRIDYTDDEHEVWRAVWQSLEPLHARYACREYLDASQIIALSRQTIPQLW